jgi:hypothetical protein
MRLTTLAILLCLVTVAVVAKADDRNWQTGTLMASQKQQVPAGSTAVTTTDGSENNRGDYSQNTIKTKSDDYDTYQVFTIQSGNITYVVREHLFFPWSKPADLTLGKPVRFALDNNSMYLLDSDGKEHKVSIVKTALAGS